MIAQYMLAPSGFYIGLLVVDNAHLYASGRTLDVLEKNIKAAAYQQKRISQRQVKLDTKPTEELDLSYASNMFKNKFVKVKPNRPEVVATKNKIVSAPKPQVEYLCERKDGEMIVYEVKEVARYKVHKPATKNV